MHVCKYIYVYYVLVCIHIYLSISLPLFLSSPSVYSSSSCGFFFLSPFLFLLLLLRSGKPWHRSPITGVVGSSKTLCILQRFWFPLPLRLNLRLHNWQQKWHSCFGRFLLAGRVCFIRGSLYVLVCLFGLYVYALKGVALFCFFVFMDTISGVISPFPFLSFVPASVTHFVS